MSKEAHRYLLHLVEELKADWADGVFEGKTQEETGYLSSMARNRMLILQTVIGEVFEPGGKIGE